MKVTADRIKKIILNPEWYNPPNPQARRRPRRLIERKTV
jgi:hypothetical protein